VCGWCVGWGGWCVCVCVCVGGVGGWVLGGGGSVGVCVGGVWVWMCVGCVCGVCMCVCVWCVVCVCVQSVNIFSVIP